jgi:hypothetical protein
LYSLATILEPVGASRLLVRIRADADRASDVARHDVLGVLPDARWNNVLRRRFNRQRVGAARMPDDTVHLPGRLQGLSYLKKR